MQQGSGWARGGNISHPGRGEIYPIPSRQEMKISPILPCLGNAAEIRIGRVKIKLRRLNLMETERTENAGK
jgi:hypothetical protein